MKKLVICVLLFSFILALSACGSSDPPIGDKKTFEKQVFADYVEQFYPDRYPHERPTGFATLRYYTTDNGYHILLLEPNYISIGESYEQTIAGYTFTLGPTAKLMAYKNGKFIELKTAYRFFLVSKKAIAETYEKYLYYRGAVS